MVTINSILFFINIILKYFIELFLWDAIILKALLILVISLVWVLLIYHNKKKRLRLSYQRKLRLKFPYAYIFKNNFDQVKSTIILFIYIFFFIICILGLRFYGMDRTVDLKIYYNILKSIIQYSSTLNLCLSLILVAIGVLLYRKMISYLLGWLRYHRLKIHLYCVIFNSYTYLFYKFDKYNLTHLYSEFVQNIMKLFYFLGLKHIKTHTGSLTYDISRQENCKPFEFFFINYLICKSFRIHYHILLIIFIIDLFYNQYVITFTYMILPIIFMYDIWVKLSNGYELKNITYDIALHHIIHIPLTEIHDYSLTFGKKNYEKQYLRDITKQYLRNDFKDKTIEELRKKIREKHTLLIHLSRSLSFTYFCVFLLCDYIVL